jgi:hypothetical protein
VQNRKLYLYARQGWGVRSRHIYMHQRLHVHRTRTWNALQLHTLRPSGQFIQGLSSNVTPWSWPPRTRISEVLAQCSIYRPSHFCMFCNLFKVIEHSMADWYATKGTFCNLFSTLLSLI